ncbi:MAG TPA: hypothetical protein DDW45_03375 [Gammaproteobacteria bacterium]|nr:hypothetical protein [Gammaproteobacteria bacterium]
MKSQLIAFTLIAATASGIALYPSLQNAATLPAVSNNPVKLPPIAAIANQQQHIEVVFVLDTTGSMGGLIKAAKEKIWSIASNMAAAESAPEIRMGLVAYRDRGDAYVTRTVDLSSDLDSVYATLMDFQADGGGDSPESVNQALDDALNKISWSRDQNSYKVIFVVGDAPPHMDYQDDVKYPLTLAKARARGIVVNSIQCGSSSATTHRWKQIAQLGSGHYFQVEQAGSAVAIATPYDEKIARLSKQLDDTRLYYGGKEAKEKQRKKMLATDKLHADSSVESLARRAAFNASTSGKANSLGEGELVDAVNSGRVDLESIKKDQLPEPMQAMSPSTQKALIADTAKRRSELSEEIGALTRQRAGYLEEKVAESGDAEASLDHKIFSAVRKQAKEKGLKYESDKMAY